MAEIPKEENNIWYDNDGFTLHLQDRIYYSQCGANGAMSLFELLKKTTDISTEDFRRRGMSMRFLNEQGFARIVSRSSFRIHRMPLESEKIEIITAEEKPEALNIVQTYEFRAEDGSPLISGESSWTMIDIHSKRIVPTKNFTLREAPDFRKVHDCLPRGRIAKPDSTESLGKRQIGAACLDGNGHADNAWYIVFVLDALPESYAKKMPSDFRINYSRELLLGDQVELFASFETKDNEEIVTVIGKKAEETSFECELRYHI